MSSDPNEFGVPPEDQAATSSEETGHQQELAREAVTGEPLSLSPIEEPVIAELAASAEQPERVEPEPVSQLSLGPKAGSETLGWLHWSSLVFDIVAHFRSYIVPMALALFGAAQGNTTYVFIGGLFFIPALIVSVMRYMTLRYSLVDGELQISSGLIFRRFRNVPVSRIQNVDLVQNVLHRMVGVAEVKVETASGTEPEAVLRVLSMQQIEELRNGIFAGRTAENQPRNATAGASNIAADPRPSVGFDTSEFTPENFEYDGAAQPQVLTPVGAREVLSIPISWLIKAGLSSNRGLIMVGILVGLAFQFDAEDYISRSQIIRLWEMIPKDWGMTTQIIGGVLAALILLILLRLVGIIWFILRFHGYRMEQRGEDLRISCGLFTRVSATVPIRRIQVISVHQNLVMRWLKMASIRIETAGGAGNDSEDASATISRRWFVPVLPVDRVPGVLKLLRKDLDWDPDSFDWQPLSRLAGRRMGRVAIVLVLLFAVLGWVATRNPWGLLLGLLIWPIFAWYVRKKSRSMKYCRTDFGVVYRSGLLIRKTSVTFFERIQTLALHQSPFDRRWKMASLTIDTAAVGPAEHSFAIGYLDETMARAEFEAINEKAGRHQPLFV